MPMAMDGREEEEDILGDQPAGNAEEDEEGEDLFGPDMLDDYKDRPEDDQYDPAMLDDTEHERMTMEQRRAAERAMLERDRREGRSAPQPRMAATPQTPGFKTSSPGGSEGNPDSARPTKRRRRSSAGGAAPGGGGPPEDGGGSEGGDEDDEDEDVPEHSYDLAAERMEEGAEIEKRLETKIKRCFQQFLLHFKEEGKAEPRYRDSIKAMAEADQLHLDVKFGHLQQWSPVLALWVADYPNKILPMLNETLILEAARKFPTYQALRDREENELRVAMHSFPVEEPIRELTTRHLNKLVCVQGVVTKRSKVFNEVKRLFMLCAKCNFQNGPFDVVSDKEFNPGMCSSCQSKGPWRVDRQQTLYRNHQKITIQESPSKVEAGKMPRSKEVVLYGDQVDTVRPGDELQLTGTYRCLYDAGMNARTCFPVFRTQIDAIHASRRGDVKLMQITDEKRKEIQDLAKDPNIRERFIASMAPSIYGMKHVKTAIALSMMGGQPKVTSGKHRIRGDINTLVVGDPGLAKSQILKYIEQTFPRAVYTTGKGASAVGLTAAVTRDPETGDWALEGGAMVLADDGMCLIDEFDKMNDKDRTSLHEAMEQQSISISKAGIVATLQARCSVVAVANPTEGRYDPQRTFAQNTALTDPILSRFDILCVLRDESDPVQDERLAEHVVCSHIRSHPDANAEDKSVRPKLAQTAEHVEPIDQELLKYYIIYARKNVHPKIVDIDRQKLANFYVDLRAESFRSGGAPMTARHTDSICRLAEASARMELRHHVTSKDLDFAIAVMLESFIQSQKHQIAEELRKKFSRYIVQGTSFLDQFVAIVERLYKDSHERIRLLRGNAPDIREVSVDIAEVLRVAAQQGLDEDEAKSFMESRRFQQLFRVEGDKLHRQL